MSQHIKSVQVFPGIQPLRPESNPARPGLHVEATKHLSQYDTNGDPAHLETAIQESKRAVDMTPHHDPNWPHQAGFLAFLYIHRYEKAGSTRDRQAGLELLRQIADDENYSSRFHNLGVLYYHTYEETGNVADLQAAISQFQEYRNRTAISDLHRACRIEALQIAHRKSTDAVPDLSSALQLLKRSLAAAPDHPEEACRTRALALTHQDLYSRSADQTHLDLAIGKYQEALKMTSKNLLDAVYCLDGLATVYYDKYLSTRDMDYMKKSILEYQRALDLLLAIFPDKAHEHQNEALKHKVSYIQSGSRDDIDRAISQYQKGFDLLPENHPYRGDLLDCLVKAYSDKYHREYQSIKSCQRVIAEYQKALRITPIHEPCTNDVLIESPKSETESRSTDDVEEAKLMEASITAYQKWFWDSCRYYA